MRCFLCLAILFAVGQPAAATQAGEWLRQTSMGRHSWKNLLGQSPDKAPSIEKTADGPSLFEKMNNGTKDFFARTSGMFLRERNQSVIHPPKPAGGMFSKKPPKNKNAWSGANEPGVPQTIDEWMKLKRPEKSL